MRLLLLGGQSRHDEVGCHLDKTDGKWYEGEYNSVRYSQQLDNKTERNAEFSRGGRRDAVAVATGVLMLFRMSTCLYSVQLADFGRVPSKSMAQPFLWFL